MRDTEDRKLRLREVDALERIAKALEHIAANGERQVVSSNVGWHYPQTMKGDGFSGPPSGT